MSRAIGERATASELRFHPRGRVDFMKPAIH
jgi:hypothetical protein